MSKRAPYTIKDVEKALLGAVGHLDELSLAFFCEMKSDEVSDLKNLIEKICEHRDIKPTQRLRAAS